VDSSWLLPWAVGIIAATTLFRLLGMPRVGRKGWIAVHVLILAALWLGELARPALGGPLAAALWLLLVLVPQLGDRLVGRWIAKRRWTAARRLAAVLAVLHPADGWPARPGLVRAYELLDRGDAEGAAALVERHGRSGSPLARAARAQLFGMRRDWTGLRAWVESSFDEEALRDDPAVVFHYLRALAETGDLEALATVYCRYERPLAAARLRDPARMLLFAWAGRPGALRRLFEGPLRSTPADAREYWLAVAEEASGEGAAARRRLETVRDSADGLLRAAAERRLAGPAPEPRPIASPATLDWLDRLERTFDEEERFDLSGAAARSRPWATFALLGLNLAMFVVAELMGGSIDGRTLHRLGALDSEVPETGEWWRVATSMFLHLGIAHLAMNGVGLLFFGRFAEYALGRLRFLAVYFVSGAAAALAAVALMRAMAEEHPSILVGASGCIFGAIGATAALLARGWRRERSEAARRRLVSLASLALFQAVFDLAVLTPVSFLAHSGGLVAGFVLTWLLSRNR
jgi:rhomboid protease GluP